jgi:hypothetical protein
MVMCHMLADSDDELHAMADQLGMSRDWWQSPDRMSGSHYDIALSKRREAISAGRRDNDAAGRRNEYVVQ